MNYKLLGACANVLIQLLEEGKIDEAFLIKELKKKREEFKKD